MERGLFWTGKESLVFDVDRLLREGADVNSTDEVQVDPAACYPCVAACRFVRRDVSGKACT